MSFVPSLINTIPSDIERLVIPVGVGIATNTSPSLFPYIGALAYDETNTGALYVGTGSVWVDSSLSASEDLEIPLINFTATNAQPSLVGNMYLKIIGLGLDTIPMRYFVLSFSQTINITSAAVWSCAAGTIPLPYLPSAQWNFPGVIDAGGNFNSANVYLSLNIDGSVELGITAATGSTLISNFSGNYSA